MLSEMLSPSIGVVVVNYKGLADTVECLESLKTLTYPSFFVVVVDNASGNEEADKIASAFPTVEVLPQSKNLGFTGGNNVGIKRVLDRGADYVFLLNNDTTVPPSLLDVLCAAMASDATLGAVGPIMLYYDQPDRVAAAGASLDYKGRCFNHLSNLTLEEVTRLDPFDVEFVHGSALMLRRSVIEATGLLDDRFFLNFEEIDWCTRILECTSRLPTCGPECRPRVVPSPSSAR
jgi:hypothetical protein